ncbi:Fc.00g058790.m01.CDS01 [Cosmosporella sp. VM-42]
MAFLRHLCFAVAAAAVGVKALSLDGTPLKELLVDHGNGTVNRWTQEEYSDLKLSSFDVVELPLDFKQSFKEGGSASIQELSADPGAYIKQTFCNAFKARYANDLYDDARNKFCQELSDLATYYFSAMVTVVEHQVCETDDGADFACGFILFVIEQSVRGTIGPEAKEFCPRAFDAIHDDCGSTFGGVDTSVTETNGNERGVEYRNAAIDDDAASCDNIENPTPGRPYQCKVLRI